ncbi:MAG: hypothetical protein ABEK50_04695 [bacterium]
MEKVTNEDGFNIVVTLCDNCNNEIANLAEADQQWYTVDIKPLVRDEWAQDINEAELHFCSSECFRSGLSDYDPTDRFNSYLE